LHTPKVAARCLLLAKYRLVLLAIIARVSKESCEGGQISNAIAVRDGTSHIAVASLASLLSKNAIVHFVCNRCTMWKVKIIDTVMNLLPGGVLIFPVIAVFA